MRRSHGMHIVDFAIGPNAIVVGRPIPAGASSFGFQWLGIGGDERLSEVGAVGGQPVIVRCSFGPRSRLCARGVWGRRHTGMWLVAASVEHKQRKQRDKKRAGKPEAGEAMAHFCDRLCCSM